MQFTADITSLWINPIGLTETRMKTEAILLYRLIIPTIRAESLTVCLPLSLSEVEVVLLNAHTK
jgi:hypothetical protein